MSYDKLLTAGPGVWTITLTQGSASASAAGILLVTAGVREGDAVLDDEGRILVIKALTETGITLAWPYKAATRTIDLVVEQRSINRAINTASSTAAIAALTRLQNAADLAPNYPVLSHGNTPPAAPADGDRHLVGSDPSGIWVGKAEHLALYSAATSKWSFTPPEDGMSVVLAGTSARLQYNGTAWGLDALGADGGRLTGPLDWASAVDVASAPTVDLGAVHSNLVNITGATTIVAFGTAANGVWRLVRFAGALTLTHGASLALPTRANLATAAGDWALFVSRGGGVWQCSGYDRADGTPLALGAGTVTMAKLADASVSNTKLADMAAGTIKLRAIGAGSGAPADGTPAQARAIVQVIDPTPSLIVNGALQHSQENGDTVGTVTNPSNWFHAADEIFVGVAGSGLAVSAQRVALMTLAGNRCRIRVSVTTAKASLAAADTCFLQQRIEGERLTGLRFGSTAARRLAGSFMFKGPAGTYGYALANVAGTRAWVGTFTISAAQANTDTLQTFTIDPETTGVWTLLNATGAYFSLILGAGPDQFGSLGWNTTWRTTTSAQTNGLSSTSNVFEIGDLDLYPDISGIGAVRPFVAPDPGAELLRCQRYYWKYDIPFGYYGGLISTSIARLVSVKFPIAMRIAPTCTYIFATNGAFAGGHPLVDGVSVELVNLRADVTADTAWSRLTSFSATARM